MHKNEYEYDVEGEKLSVAILATRVVTMACLIVCVAVFHTNTATFSRGYVYTYSRVFSYKYAFTVALIGFAANFFLTILYVVRKKLHLLNSSSFLKACLYVDKVAATVVATGGGAALCGTVDLKRVKWNEYNSERQGFLSVGYIAAAFLLLGCATSLLSSIHSSLALSLSSSTS